MPSRFPFVGLLIGSVFLVAPALVNGQDRGFVVGNLGFTFAERTDSSFGFTAGVGITPSIQIIGTYSHMNDTLTGNFAQFLRTLSGVAGLNIEGKLPAEYGAGGIRFVVQNRETVQVYFQAEGGVGKVSPELRFFDGMTDITDEVGDLSAEETAGALALGAGVRVLLGPVVTGEVGFKWLNIMTDIEPLKVNRLDFGLGVRF